MTNEVNESVKTNLVGLWNWAENKSPNEFTKSDGKEWLNIDVYRGASRLNITPEQFVTAMRDLFKAGEIDVKKVSNNKLLFSLSPEPEVKPEPDINPKSIADRWSAYFDSMSAEDRYSLWNITINKEWEVCSDEAKAFFKNDIQNYFRYRRIKPVNETIKQRVFDKIRSGEFTNVYAPAITVSAEDCRKQAQRGWSKITTTGVDFKSKFSIDNDDTPPDPF